MTDWESSDPGDDPVPPPPSSDAPSTGRGDSNASGCMTAFGVVSVVVSLFLFANRPSEATRNNPDYAGLGDFIWVIMNAAAWCLMVVGVVYVLIGRSVFKRRRR